MGRLRRREPRVFESYLKGSQRTRRARALSLMLSVGVHGGGVGLLIVLSLFHVEELPEPQVNVTFFAVAPPPPPPPPPPAAQPRMRPRRPKAPPRPAPEAVQPPDKPPPRAAQPEKPEPPSAPQETEGGSEDGVEGGVEGGVPGGVPPPKPVEKPKAEPRKPVFVQQQVVEKLKLSGEQPSYLPAARMAQVQGVIIVKLCLDTQGQVDMNQTKILKGLPVLDEEVLSKVRAWRYQPYLVDGIATPVCFPVRFIFRLQ